MSNPASQHRTSSALDTDTDIFTTPFTPSLTNPPKLSLQTNQPLTPSFWPSATTASAKTNTNSTDPLTPITPITDTNTTYLVEVTNYPALQNPRTRASLLAKGDYDAVLLVYDITSRSSFDSISALHSEIPLAHKSRNRRSSVRKSRSSFFHQRKGSDTRGAAGADDAAAAAGTGGLFFGSGGGGFGGGRETVVALVGNKTDIDSAEFGGTGEVDLGYPLVEKEAVLQAAGVEERSLVHPLFRMSAVGGFEDEELALSPPLRSPRSVRSVPVRGSRLEVEDVARRTRSVVSDGPGVRASVFSVAKRGSLNLVPEDGRVEEEVARSRVPMQRRRPAAVEMPPTPPEEATAAIQKWLEVDGESHSGGGYEEEQKGREAEAEVVHRRQVSRFEGEMLARTLLLNVPFRETSAKTGENVEEMFEAIVREVLWEMGKEVGPLEQQPEERHVKRKAEKDVQALSRKRSVLKKERKGEEKTEEQTRESVASDRPPVLTLPGLEEEDRHEKKNPMDETAEKVVETDPVEQTLQASEAAPKRRCESVLGSFFKKVFTKKSAPMVPEVTV